MRTKRQPFDDFSLKTGEQPMADAQTYVCMASGCNAHASYPAPKNRAELRNYIWFCLDHIRAYNSSWNYYDGIEGEALEREIRNATTWERPSWKFGTGPSAKTASSQPFSDPFDLFDGDTASAHPAQPAMSAEEKKAWSLFDLTPDSDAQTVKKRYNQLAKSLHPDHHKNDLQAEEKLKEINLAYSVLRKYMMKDKSKEL